MNFNTAQFAAIVENAKKAAASSPRWTRAIDRKAGELPPGPNAFPPGPTKE